MLILVVTLKHPCSSYNKETGHTQPECTSICQHDFSKKGLLYFTGLISQVEFVMLSQKWSVRGKKLIEIYGFDVRASFFPCPSDI